MLELKQQVLSGATSESTDTQTSVLFLLVYHEASTFGTEALMSKNNNSLSSRKSETQVVQDWLKW